MAGYRELLAVEWDDNAVETFKLNFPDVPVYHGDIVKLSVEQVLEMTGLQVGELHVFDGSPPCQGFSTSGRRDMDDPRNQLFREYVRLLRGLKPKVFVVENVSGMVKGKMKLIFVDILRELKTSGYQVSARLLNAKYFNVPQSRERMIFIGVRDDLGIAPSHPKAQRKPFTVREAIEQDGLPASLTLISQEQPAPKLTPQYLAYWNAAQQGKTVGAFRSNTKLHTDSPSPTLSKSEGNGGVYHPTEPRGISTGERKRLASYPDPFQFTDWASAVQRIGNSVPPLFMRAIAHHIHNQILARMR